MGALGGGLLVVGLAALGMVAFARTLRDVEPDPRASEARQAEARRTKRELETIIDPWMLRLGLAAVVVGGALVAIELIT